MRRVGIDRNDIRLSAFLFRPISSGVLGALGSSPAEKPSDTLADDGPTWVRRTMGSFYGYSPAPGFAKEIPLLKLIVTGFIWVGKADAAGAEGFASATTELRNATASASTAVKVYE